MQPVSILLNVLWILFGGAEMAFGWLIAAVIMAITIIGLPWARASLNIAFYTLLPFGSRVRIPGYHNGEPVPVLDRGGAIKGYHLDVFFPSHQQALDWGRRWVVVEIE